MSIKNKIITSLLTLGMISMPIVAEAEFRLPLQISNTTNYDLSLMFTTGCLSVTPAHTSSYIPSTTMGLACLASPVICYAQAYQSKNCSGPHIGTLAFMGGIIGLMGTEIIKDDYLLAGAGLVLVMSDHKNQ